MPRTSRLARIGVVLLALLLPAAAALAFDPASTRFRRLDQDQGLSQSSVLALAQDRHGFIWMGTQDGLNRFDGFDVSVFRPQRGRSDALSNNWVGALAVDHEGRLWVGTQAGLNRFDATRETFTVYRHDPARADSLPGDSIHALHVDHNGQLWVGSNGGLARWSAQGDHFERVPLPPPPPTGSAPRVEDPRVRALASSADGSLWIGTVRGLLRFDLQQRSYVALSAAAGEATRAPIHALVIDDRQQLWLGSEGHGLARLDLASGRWTSWRHEASDPASLGSDQVHSLLQARDGSLWVGHEVGVDRLASEAQGFDRFRHHRHAGHSLGRGRVTALLQDRRGTLWLGSWEGGASRLDEANNRFVSYTPDTATTAALRQPGIAALAAEGDSLWLGGAEGLYRFRPGQRRLEAIPNAPASFIYGIDKDSEALWLGTRDGLRRLDRQGTPMPLDLPAVLDKARTRRFLRDGDALWLAADTLGLYLLTDGGRQIAAFHPIASVVTFIRVLDDQHVLVGAHDGLYWFDRRSGALRHRHTVHNDAGPHQLPAGPSDLLRASDGRLWLATYGGGLLRIEPADGDDPAAVHFVRFGREHGLSDEAINGIVEDDRGRLWLSVNGYIARFEPDSGQFRSFDRADGVLPRYWIGAQARLASGEIAFAGPDGLTLFDPAGIGAQPTPPTPLITAMELDNRPAALQARDPDSALAAPPYLAGLVSLPPARARTLGLRFSAPEYVAPEQARFAYRLDGFDADWIEDSRQRRFATYTNLPHGDYVFRVKLRNGDGEWSADEARLALHIAPFWWQTWWAVAGAILLAAGALAAGFVLRIRQLGAQRRRLQREVETRTSELRQALQKLALSERLAAAGQLTAGIAHEINNPANFVQVASQNLQHRLREFHAFLLDLAGDEIDVEVANALAGQFAGLDDQVDTVLEGSRRIHAIVQDLRVFSRLDEAERKPVPLDEPLHAALRLVAARFGADIHVDENLAARPMIDGQPAQLSQAFYCLLQNACQAIAERRQHAPAGFHGELQVASRLHEATHEVEVEIRDNGNGIAADVLPHIFEPFYTTRPVGEGSGLGLAVAWGIVAEHGGRIEVDSTPGEGSRFRVVLPTRIDHA